jgi:hypothetical protein
MFQKTVFIFHGRSHSSPWLGLFQSLMAWVIKPSWRWQEVAMFVSSQSWGNVSTMCETLYGFIFWRSFVGLGYYLVASLWKTADTISSSSSSSSSTGPLFLLLLLLAEHYPVCYKDGFVFLCPHKSNTLTNDWLTWWEQNRSKPTA